MQKGESPIEKNVIVTDSQGNEYEATYPRRAVGLVKNGRARFVGENKICLACPPIKISEDKKMNSNINEEIKKSAFDDAIPDNMQELPKNITPEYVLNKIDLIQRNNDEFYSKFSAHLATMSDDALEQIKEIIKFRETTNQRIIQFYEELYKNVTPLGINTTLKWITDCVAKASPGIELPNFSELIKQLRST